jgi:hypothetical protein
MRAAWNNARAFEENTMAIHELALDDLTAEKLWSALDPATRELAARAVYSGSEDDRIAPAEADAAIARALRFRLVAVRRLPLDKRVDYLTRVVHPDESLASSLLRTLHLVHRRDLLSAFLDELDIPHEEGIIDADYDFDARRPDAARLRAALRPLESRFPSDHVQLYAVTLLAMDRDSWAPLAEVLSARRDGLE